MQLWSTFRRHLSIPFIFIAGSIAFLYLLTTFLLPNYHLVFITLTSNYPVFYKISLIFELFFGSWYALSHLTFFLIVITSVLFGINLSLGLITLRNQKKSNMLPLTTSGTGMVMAAVGCPSCGLSMITLLWPSLTLSFLPFRGLEIQLIGVLILFVALYSLLQKIASSDACAIPQRT